MHDQTIIALAAEKQELLISSGPQDRVIQTYGGLMFMDFQKDLMINRGYGNYSSLNLHNECLKGLWIAYVAQPKNSGKVHNLVRQRFENGDLEVLNGMKTLSDLSDQAAIALNRNNRSELAKLMDLNFEARKRLYGLEVLGEASLRMIEIAHQHDFAAKFSGSGGCIVGLWRGKVGSIEEKEAMSILKVDLENEGFVFAYVLRGNDDTEA